MNTTLAGGENAQDPSSPVTADEVHEEEKNRKLRSGGSSQQKKQQRAKFVQHHCPTAGDARHSCSTLTNKCA